MNLKLAHEKLSGDTASRVTFAKNVVASAVPVMRDNLGKVESQFKYDDSRVTAADIEISEHITANLKERFPLDIVCSEESTDPGAILDVRSSYAWVLDPIDGTNNYALGMNACAISLALLKDGHIIYGIVYDMSRDTFIQGGPNIGAWENESPISVLRQKLDDQSIIALHFPIEDKYFEALVPFIKKHKVRCLGSVTLQFIYVALGKLDGSVALGLSLWDVAGALAIIQGAGGQYYFLPEDRLPLTEVSVKTAHATCWSGTEDFCTQIGAAIKRCK